MKIKDLIPAIKAANGDLLRGVNDKQMAAIIRGVLGEIRQQIDQTEEGGVMLPRLGRFVIRKVLHEEKPEQAPGRRVVLLRPRSKSPEGDADKGPAKRRAAGA